MVVALIFKGLGSNPCALQLLLLFLLVFGVPAMSFVLGEECDWSGSGLGHGPQRGVTPVYLRCAKGRVSWVYPGGALRVLLRLGSSGREFRGCIKASTDFAGARLFLEGSVRLVSLLDAEPTPRVQCFSSRHGQVALYLEALQKTPSAYPRLVAQFDYDLEPLPRNGQSYDTTQDCRPCSPEEMTHAFCSSDLVTRGIIRSVETLEDLKVSELTVKVTKQLRESTPGDDLEESIESNDLSSLDKEEQVKLQVPEHCGVRRGAGEFVFMARRKLGDLVLRCAPRLEDWAEVVRSENAKGSAHCVLHS